MTETHKLSDTEWRVMNVLWDARDADTSATRTARQVLSSVEEETAWAYTTVKTILSRLAEKGIVTATLEGNTTHFAPAITRELARRSALRGLLDRAFDGTVGSLIHHLVEGEKLSARDRRELAALLGEDHAAAGRRRKESRGP